MEQISSEQFDVPPEQLDSPTVIPDRMAGVSKSQVGQDLQGKVAELPGVHQRLLAACDRLLAVAR
jgi:hypothetical protein